MIVDALTHINPDPRAFGPKYDAGLDFLLKNLDESPVDKAVIVAIDADTHYATDSEFVAECCHAHPDKLIGFASVNPIRDPDAIPKFERYVTELGLRGLKLHPRHQHLAVDDPRVTPVVQKAAELRVPVAICGSQWKHAPLRDQLPINVDVLCKRVPEARIILTHAGGFHFMDALALAVANENVFLETSISLRYFHETPFEDQFMFVLKKIGARRVIYGSDHPEDPVKTCYERSLAIFKKHGFGDEECDLIFGRNILTLVGMAG